MSPAINGASWSLFVEIFAILAMLLTFAAVRFGRSGAMVAIIAIAILILYKPAINKTGNLALFWFMFAFGMAAAYWRPSRLPAGPLAIAMIFIPLVAARPLFGYMNTWALLTECICSTYIVAALAYSKQTAVHSGCAYRHSSFWEPSPTVFCLYHPLALDLLSPHLMPIGNWAVPFAVSCAIAITTIALTIPMAWISYNLIEGPFVRLSRKYL